MRTTHNLNRIIAGALLSGGIAVAGSGLAAPAQAGPSYWHYCPGHWEYTVPVPAGGFVRRVARTPHYGGVKRDAKEPAVIALFGIAPVEFALVDQSKPAWRTV